MADGSMVCVGVVTSPRGIRGEVKVKTFTDDPRSIAAYGPLVDEAGRRFKLKVVGEAKGQMVVRIDGVSDRNAAEALRGTKLMVPRSALPETTDEDEFYHADLVGLVVETVDGEYLGKVRGLFDFGAGDVVDVVGGDRGSVMIPFTKAAVPVVDLAAGRLVVEPPPGLLEPATPEDRDEEMDEAGAVPQTAEDAR